MADSVERYLQRFNEQTSDAAVNRLLEGAERHDEAARTMREKAAEGRAQIIKERTAKSRELPRIVGGIDSCLLHYFGKDIEGEVINTLKFRDSDTEGFADFLDFAEEVGMCSEPTPVYINVPQIQRYWSEEPSYWRDVSLTLVKPETPFFASEETEEAALMHAFTGSKADVIKRKLGLNGTTFSGSAEYDRGSLGNSERFKRGDEKVLMRREGRADGISGTSAGTYSYGGVNESLVYGTPRPVDYAIGWAALQELVLAEGTSRTKIRAAKKIATFVAYTINGEFQEGVFEQMPRVVEILEAERALTNAMR